MKLSAISIEEHKTTCQHILGGKQENALHWPRHNICQRWNCKILPLLITGIS